MVGNTLRNSSNNKEYAYYECNVRKRNKTCRMKPINKEYIEGQVIDTLYVNLFADDVITLSAEKMYTYANTTMQDAPDMVIEYKKQLANVEKQINNIVTAIANGMYHQSMKEKMDELELSKSAIKIRLAEAKLKKQTHSISLEQIYDIFSLYKDIKTMLPTEQRKAVQIFVSDVIINEDTCDIIISTDQFNKNSTDQITSATSHKILDTMVTPRGFEPL